jgi:hypothetical protein
MKIGNLKSLRKRIEETERIAGGYYFTRIMKDSSPCLCAIGHVFLEGKATEDEIEEFSQMNGEDESSGMNGSSINTVVEKHTDLVGGWLRTAGFNPKKKSDMEFLGELQRINDNSFPEEERKEKLLNYIDKVIVMLESEAREEGNPQ